MFFAGLALLLATFAALYFSGMLFDAGGKRRLGAFVFQPNDLSVDRVGRPIPADQLSEKFIREKLIGKFVIEYFYAAPDIENIARRTRADSVLAAMSAPDVFNDWLGGQAEEIERLAENKSMRSVSVGEIVRRPGSDYWEVFYELKTWESPNDMNLKPAVRRGVMLLRMLGKESEDNEGKESIREIRDTINGRDFDVRKHLDNGGDPSIIFKFKISEVR
jgi:hypothetical protein